MPKTCTKCRKEKPTEAFSPKRNQCKRCVNAVNHRNLKANPKRWQAKCAKTIKRRSADPATPAANKRRKLRCYYGITIEDFERMLEAQGGACAICRRKQTHKALTVDHCHTTGKVRGLLCLKCNTAIGLLNDDPKRLEAAIRYLKPEHSNAS